ncbi:MAG: hypothetical protein MRK01_15675 [Candidatus Scalindua sp.]|nr:hypothetical protein [Candidatus Scalindua sp.]
MTSRSSQASLGTGDLALGTNRAISNVTVLIDFEWDIQLQATRESEVVTETKLSYIKVI